jgi:hypothetical protein
MMNWSTVEAAGVKSSDLLIIDSGQKQEKNPG